MTLVTGPVAALSIIATVMSLSDVLTKVQTASGVLTSVTAEVVWRITTVTGPLGFYLPYSLVLLVLLQVFFGLLLISAIVYIIRYRELEADERKAVDEFSEELRSIWAKTKGSWRQLHKPARWLWTDLRKRVANFWRSTGREIFVARGRVFIALGRIVQYREGFDWRYFLSEITNILAWCLVLMLGLLGRWVILSLLICLFLPFTIIMLPVSALYLAGVLAVAGWHAAYMMLHGPFFGNTVERLIARQLWGFALYSFTLAICVVVIVEQFKLAG